MSGKATAFLVAGLLVVAWLNPKFDGAIVGKLLALLQQNKPAPVVPVVDDMGTGDQLKAALVGEHAKADAAYMAAVLDATAERLEADGKDSPKVTSRVQVETLFANVGAIATTSKTKGRYPQLPDVLGKFFAAHFPKEQGALTDADRALAVKLFKALAAGFRKAANG